MAKANEPEKMSTWGRLKQIGTVFKFTAKRDRVFVPLAVLAGAVPLVAAILAVILDFGWLWLPVGILGSLLGLMLVLNFRSRKAIMIEAEGQPGAAASIVDGMRGDWRVRPVISSTTQFDMVHLVIGRPGVILLGEGDPQRVRGLIRQEQRRLAKVIGNAKMYDFIIGNDEGQLPLKKLQSTLIRLPKAISGKDVNTLDKRLTALSSRPQMPKGAVPKSMRPPKGAFRSARGGR